MKQKTRVILAILTLLILAGGYEYYVYLWSLKEETAVIRVDVIMVYPIIFGLSAGVYYLLGRFKK